MHQLTCGISSLLHSVNLILFTVPPGSPHPANLSFQTGTFPSCFKRDQVLPLFDRFQDSGEAGADAIAASPAQLYQLQSVPQSAYRTGHSARRKLH